MYETLSLFVDFPASRAFSAVAGNKWDHLVLPAFEGFPAYQKLSESLVLGFGRSICTE